MAMSEHVEDSDLKIALSCDSFSYDELGSSKLTCINALVDGTFYFTDHPHGRLTHTKDRDGN